MANEESKDAKIVEQLQRKHSSENQMEVNVPDHRFTPLKENWMKIFEPIVERLKLQIRYNSTIKRIQLRTTSETPDMANLLKGADFIKAFICGFEVEDALAFLRLEDLFIETFQLQDVKRSLKGDHLSRAVGRLAGKNGTTKFTIENVTNTRIVVTKDVINILGSYDDIQVARRWISNLILGLPPSKVHGQLRNYSGRKRY